jgi:hypothetical protein
MPILAKRIRPPSRWWYALTAAVVLASCSSSTAPRAFAVEGPNAFQGGTNIPIGGVTDGNFRLYFDVRLGPGDGAPPAADSLKLSNVFRVRTSEAPPP